MQSCSYFRAKSCTDHAPFPVLRLVLQDHDAWSFEKPAAFFPEHGPPLQKSLKVWVTRQIIGRCGVVGRPKSSICLAGAALETSNFYFGMADTGIVVVHELDLEVCCHFFRTTSRRQLCCQDIPGAAHTHHYEFSTVPHAMPF